ncbi:hypothetical protein CLIB1423_11S02652 [[Candida] railenensis]|uniref:Uncharacterized protein n=1 Tax=[Candida] railenensis TaxID=45579 RepID=A0A9P0QQC8_9ASCO|nr:hypothetical protein CLIB1423_11S02652 [[Candida] railenensis]
MLIFSSLLFIVPYVELTRLEIKAPELIQLSQHISPSVRRAALVQPYFKTLAIRKHSSFILTYSDGTSTLALTPIRLFPNLFLPWRQKKESCCHSHMRGLDSGNFCSSAYILMQVRGILKEEWLGKNICNIFTHRIRSICIKAQVYLAFA